MVGNKYLPNTLLLSVVKRTKPEFCNSKFKQLLETKGIIISVGSACNTADKLASHVVRAMNMDALLKKGVLRISMPDNVKVEQVDRFIAEFIAGLKTLQ
jgi:cysteine sulfinate desulfinase/cysteine desulfurase-like protein